MRLTKLKLRWFRGSSGEAQLSAGKKSLVVYGENGSGKSSFVDAIEYVLNGGRIGHLAHEYSGRRQEKGILNTHIPNGETGAIQITLEDESEITVSISANGNFSLDPENSEISQWGCKHTILRQNELADFITDTKGGKYSSLLPLLGLGDLEIAAENLRQLEKAISDEAGVSIKKNKLANLKAQAENEFGVGQEFDSKLNSLIKKYTGDKKTSEKQQNYRQSVTAVLNALKDRIDKLSKEQRTHTTLNEISKLALKSGIESVQNSALTLSQFTEPLINERLGILQEAEKFSRLLTLGDTVNCPACGTNVPVDSFQEHVASEQEKLKEVVGCYRDHKKNIQSLCDILRDLQRLCAKDEVSDWGKSLKTKDAEYLSEINIDDLRRNLTEEILKRIEEHLVPIINSATEAAKSVPPEIQELLDDQKCAGLISEIIDSEQITEYVSKIERLIAFIAQLQKRVREAIRARSTATIGAISDDIARMWGILHPNEKIEDVHLYLPANSDKAIEIGLKFYGLEQPSPRLTLSEGHRNSLGLCIFLSMAKHDVEYLTPILLDDVVVSFDRGHRGMVAGLLEKEFADRQILLFTHDREWFIELKQLLDSSSWEFRALMPWIDPTTGIRWSEKDSTFDDARALIEMDPAAAGNTARKIMDIHLALIAEKLAIKLPYLHRERNDHRMAHDFFVRIIADVEKCFEIKDRDTHKQFDSAKGVLQDADGLLVAWGNRASHSFDTTKSEALKLIVACENALNIFTCPSCHKLVTKNDDSGSKIRQCQCGTLRWRYGKS